MGKAFSKIKKYVNVLLGQDGSVVAKATAWFLVCSILQKCLRMITMPIFNRIMTVEEIGQFTNYTTWSEIIVILTTFRLDYGVFNKGMAKYSDHKNEYTSTMILTTTALAGFWFCIYLLFHNTINRFTGLSTAVTSAILVELMIVPAVWFWSLNQRYEYRYKAVVAVTLISSIVGTLVSAIAVVICKDKVDARIYSGLVVTVLYACVIYYICIKRSRKVFSWEYLKFAILFNIPLMPHYFSAYILEQSDKIMIREMVGMRELGFYGTACSIAATIKIVTASMTNAILPWQYEALKEKKFKEIEKKLTTSVYLVTGLILLFLCVAPEVLIILASSKYLDAIMVISPIACSVIMIYYYSLVANIEFFYDKNKFVTVLSCLCAILNIGINYVGITHFGYLGAAYATYICYLIFAVAHVIYVNRITLQLEGIRIMKMRSVILVAVLSVAVIVVMSLLYAHTVARYVLLFLLALMIIIFRKQLLNLYTRGMKESE